MHAHVSPSLLHPKYQRNKVSSLLSFASRQVDWSAKLVYQESSDSQVMSFLFVHHAHCQNKTWSSNWHTYRWKVNKVLHKLWCLSEEGKKCQKQGFRCTRWKNVKRQAKCQKRTMGFKNCRTGGWSETKLRMIHVNYHGSYMIIKVGKDGNFLNSN